MPDDGVPADGGQEPVDDGLAVVGAELLKPGPDFREFVYTVISVHNYKRVQIDFINIDIEGFKLSINKKNL
jgi:hypothetical protein